ncbi:MAG: hypothetical protein N3D75_02875 [Candidatus Aenigmarchaeota archaeon]|nr:hypothetical protein [Candidatus Aenigmarchaeota archaeon]
MGKTYAEKTADFFGSLFAAISLYAMYTMIDIASRYANTPDLPLSAIDVYNKIQPYLSHILR